MSYQASRIRQTVSGANGVSCAISMLGMQGLYRQETVALEASITRAERADVYMNVDALRSLHDRLVATFPTS